MHINDKKQTSQPQVKFAKICVLSARASEMPTATEIPLSKTSFDDKSSPMHINDKGDSFQPPTAPTKPSKSNKKPPNIPILKITSNGPGTKPSSKTPLPFIWQITHGELRNPPEISISRPTEEAHDRPSLLNKRDLISKELFVIGKGLSSACDYMLHILLCLEKTSK